MSAGHSHAIPGQQNERSLWLAFGLTTTFLIVEVIGGVVAGSLALLSDAAHMFTDTAALAIALAAIRVAKRPADLKRTFGYYRFEILAAAFNAVLLFAVALYILYEAWERFQDPRPVQSTMMLAIAVAGLVINMISMRLLAGGKDASLNIKGAYLEVWSDMLGSLGVIVGAIIIMATGWTWVDAVIAVAIGLWVLPRTYVLLKDSLNILLEGVPAGIDIEKLRAAMRAVPGVTDIHDLHVWSLTSGRVSLTAHVVHEAARVPEELRRSLQHLMAASFGINHVTLQTEVTACSSAADACFLPVSEAQGHHGHDAKSHSH